MTSFSKFTTRSLPLTTGLIIGLAVAHADDKQVRPFIPSQDYDQALSQLVVPSVPALEASYPALLRKKIIVTQFDVENPLQIEDIANIYDDLPKLLAEQLQYNGGFLSHYSPLSLTHSSQDKQALIFQLAEQHGAQFIISGSVRDAGRSHTPGKWGTPFGSVEQRRFQVEFKVYDGPTGVLLQHFNMTQLATGNVDIGRDKPIGSSEFSQTRYGQAILQLIQQSQQHLTQQLASEPFSARITRIDGPYIYIDAGADSGLFEGNGLVAFAREARSPVINRDGQLLGIPEHPIDTVIIQAVQRQFAIGKLSKPSSSHKLRPGHRVKLDPFAMDTLVASQVARQNLVKQKRSELEQQREAEHQQHLRTEKARIQALIAAEEAARREAERIAAEKEAARQRAAAAAAARRKAAAKAAAAKPSRNSAISAEQRARLERYREVLKARAKAHNQQQAIEEVNQRLKAPVINRVQELDSLPQAIEKTIEQTKQQK